MKHKILLLTCMVTAMFATGCDDSTQRKIEILAMGEPYSDVDEVNVAYAQVKQVDKYINAVDKVLLKEAIEFENSRKSAAKLDALIAETSKTPVTPGQLSPAARAAAFNAKGEFLGDRTKLFSQARQTGRDTNSIFTARDHQRKTWGSLAVAMGGAAGLMVLVAGVALIRQRSKRNAVKTA